MKKQKKSNFLTRVTQPKNDGNRVLGLSDEELAQRNLLKGITADESATVHVS